MTAEDTGLQVEAESKVTVRGAGAFTLADLRLAARELMSRGVPEYARVDVSMNTTGTPWSVKAQWEPEPEVLDPELAAARDRMAAREAITVHPCGRCGKEMVVDGTMSSGYRHLDKLADMHPATLGRPVRDSPQA